MYGNNLAMTIFNLAFNFKCKIGAIAHKGGKKAIKVTMIPRGMILNEHNHRLKTKKGDYYYYPAHMHCKYRYALKIAGRVSQHISSP